MLKLRKKFREIFRSNSEGLSRELLPGNSTQGNLINYGPKIEYFVACLFEPAGNRHNKNKESLEINFQEPFCTPEPIILFPNE